MKTALKNIAFFCGVAPLLAKLPYMLDVWIHSPTEENDKWLWLCLLWMVPLCEWVRRRARLPVVPLPHRALLTAAALCVALGGLVLAYLKGINAAAIIFGIALAAVAVDLRFGRRVFLAQMPCFFTMLLGAPSLTFWLSHYLQFGVGDEDFYLMIKLTLCVGFCVAWCLSAWWRKRYPRIISVLFCIGILASVLGTRVWAKQLSNGVACVLALPSDGDGVWVGRALTLTDADRSFFAGCKAVSRGIFYNDKTSVGALSVTVGRDIHAIHPVGICLRSNGWDIDTSRLRYAEIAGIGAVQVLAMEARRHGEPYLVWSWFSNGKISTGDFAEFRFLRKHGVEWRHYQLMTPVRDGLDAAREALIAFMTAFARPQESAAPAREAPQSVGAGILQRAPTTGNAAVP